MDVDLRLTLLGGLHITRGGVPLTGFVSAKAQALFCYLAILGRPQTRTELAGLLWGDRPEAIAAGSLRQALANLNQIVGPYLTVTRQTVAFNRDSAYWLDVERFEAGLQGAPPEAEALREAVTLYHGDLLQGFFVRDAPTFDDWLSLERERVRGLALHAFRTLTAGYALRRQFAPGLDYTRRWLTLEPWNEEAHRQLMSLLAHSGQRSAALAQYETCRRLLREALDVEPMAETIALYDRLRKAAVATPHNLPPSSTPLVGRAPELAELVRLLAQPDCRLLTLSGLSGIGKTRLALEAAQAQLANFPQGVFFAPLAALHSVDFLAPTLAEAVGLTLYAGDQPKSQLLHYLSDKRLLLVADSFEHVLEGVGLLTEILTLAPEVKILVTSTEQLNVHEEWVLSLAGLSVPPPDHDQAIEDYGAAELFLQCARRVSRNVPLTAAEKRCVARVCQLVEGMPLALELASAWVRSIPYGDIVAEIERSHDFLTTTLRDVPERHRSVRAAFNYSWEQLLPLEQEAFSQLAVFRQSFERTAAQAVALASLPVLSALVDKSLLIRTEAGRYQVHDLLRQYAKEKLEHNAVEAQARDRHLEFFLQLAEEADSKLHGPEQLLWLDRLEAEHDNIRSALEWALKDTGRGRPADRALRLAGSLGLFWDLRGHFSEGRQWLEQALALSPSSPPGLAEQSARSQALYWAGHIAKWQGDYHRAAELAAANLKLCRALGDAWRTAYALYLCGSVANKQGELGRAQQFLDESLSGFRAVNARWGLAHTLGTLGNIARAEGREAQALTWLEESHELYRRLGDRRGLARSLNRLWHWPYRQGDFGRATALLEEAAGLFRELKHRDGVAIILRHLGLVVQAQGDLKRARALFEESLALFQELGDKDDLMFTRWYLGRLLCYERELPAARVMLAESLQLAREVGNPGLIAWVLLTQASVARYQADYKTAQRLLTESLALAQQSHEKEVVADVLTGFAALALAQGQVEPAASLFGQAEAIMDSLSIALAPVVRAEYEQHLASLRAQLDEPALGSAWQRGRQMPLEQAVQLVLNL